MLLLNRGKPRHPARRGVASPRTSGRARPAREASRRSEADAAHDGQLASSQTFAHRRLTIGGPLYRPRPAAVVVAFVITLVWFAVNLRQISPLDVLPFAWTWLTVWLVVSLVEDGLRRYTGSGDRRA